MWLAKKAIVSRREPATPAWVETPVGAVDTSWRGRLFGIAGALLLGAIVPIAWFVGHAQQRSIEIAIDTQRIIEIDTDDGRRRCLLEVEVTTTNGDDLAFTVDRATTVIGQRRVGTRVHGDARVDPGADRLVLHTLVAPVSTKPCPGIEQTDRGTLTLDLRGAVAGSPIEVRRTAKL